jgi:hypothetical protein
MFDIVFSPVSLTQLNAVLGMVPKNQAPAARISGRWTRCGAIGLPVRANGLLAEEDREIAMKR